MANMGRCGTHGCAFSVRLVNGAREEYCPECALATAQAERDAALQRAEQAEAALAWVRDQLRQGRTISATDPETPTLIMEADGSVTGNLTVATQPPALPPLPPDWHERCGDTWIGFYYLEYDEDTGSQIVATRLGVDVDTIGTVNVSDLILVLRHAQAAKQRLAGGGQ